MRLRILLIALLISLPAVAADEQQSTQPADAQPAATPYVELNKQLQEKLRAEGFYSGPISGEFGFNTQAALAQFQLSRALPASGSLDATTLTALGLDQDAQASAGAGANSATVDTEARDQRRCDDLMGPEKERCLQQGGTVDTSAQSSGGAIEPAKTSMPK